MTSPNTSMQVSDVPASSGVSYIDALVAGTKWGGVLGTAATVSFSFPYAASAAAIWYVDSSIGQYSIDNEPDLASGLNGLQQAAATLALQQWANVAKLTFTQTGDTAASVGDIRFAYTSVATMSGGTWGWAYIPAAGWAPSGDIWINASVPATDPDWAIGSYNFSSLMHEIGHALGLIHPFEAMPPLSAALDSTQYTLMSYTDHPHALYRQVTDLGGGAFEWQYTYIQPSTPMLYDIAAIQYLYGANTSFATGSDVYTFDPATPFFKTIWDAGGNDTISISNFSRGSIVNLNEGAFSSLRIVSDPLPPGAVDSTVATYDGTDNLAIAFGAKIENAIGGSGNDILTGNTLANRLEGGAGSDTLGGGAGADTLLGGSGADTLDGGLGNDLYYVDAGDRVTETSSSLASGGNDTVYAAVSWTLGLNVENLRLTAAGSINGSGNVLNNLIYAGAGANVIDGGAGTDTLSYRYATTTGSAGVTLDLALVNASGQATASGISGADRIRNVENLAGSSYNDRLSGNSGANTLMGNAGNDTLDGSLGNDLLIGGLGNDSLSGGAGRDSFRFNTALNANRDTLADFSVADDTIQLENAVFTSLATTGTLAAGSFRAGAGVSSAADANDYLIYNSTSGALYYDADGNGAGAAVQFAVLGSGLALANSDFLVI